MVPKVFHLTVEMYGRVQATARKLELSEAAVIRMALEAYLVEPVKIPTGELAVNPVTEVRDQLANGEIEFLEEEQ